MIGTLPSYRTPWQHYSEEHRRLDARIHDIIHDYVADPANCSGWSFAVIGTFGAGKTQLLYHFFVKVLEEGGFPLYLFAEDLLNELIADNSSTVLLPGNVANLVQDKLTKVRKALIEQDQEAVRAVLRPRNTDTSRMVQDLLRETMSRQLQSCPVVLLVDELEQQYRTLQQRVQADDRSPLREWLEQTDHLKVLALAPAGIYEMGGADQSRCSRLVIPPVDPWYVREAGLVDGIGKANAAWWLARGKPRHLHKAIQVLGPLKTKELDSGEALRLVQNHFDDIGQEPSRVPAAELGSLAPSKYPLLLDLQPVRSSAERRFVLDMNRFDPGAAAECMQKASPSLDGATATLISSYLGILLRALADADGVVYLRQDELPEVLQLALDILIEYEHASPTMASQLGTVLGLYEGVGEGIIYNYFAPVFTVQDSERVLPLAARELRRAFPFPIMNPIIGKHLPDDVRKRFLGRHAPIWRWIVEDALVLVFPSASDFESYSTTDEFRASVLEDGRGVLAVLPAGETSGSNDALLDWLTMNKKLVVISCSPLIMDFLLSLRGRTGDDTQSTLPDILEQVISSGDDPITSRKARVYQRAIDDFVRSELPRPPRLCRSPLPDAVTVWGKMQISDANISVLGCALAFIDLTEDEKELAATLRDLFKGEREGGGVGLLKEFVPRGGYQSLADSLLPARGIRQKEIRDRHTIQKLREHFGPAENRLRQLARTIQLREFNQISADEDQRRALEAIWRATRAEFDSKDLVELTQKLEAEAIAVVKEACDVESKAAKELGLGGVNFGQTEALVHGLQGLEDLVRAAKRVSSDNNRGGPVLRAMYALFLRQLATTTAPQVRSLASDLQGARSALRNLVQCRLDLRRNMTECTKALQFGNVAEKDVDAAIQEGANIGGTPSIGEVIREAEGESSRLRELSRLLLSVNSNLVRLSSQLSTLQEG